MKRKKKPKKRRKRRELTDSEEGQRMLILMMVARERKTKKVKLNRNISPISINLSKGNTFQVGMANPMTISDSKGEGIVVDLVVEAALFLCTQRPCLSHNNNLNTKVPTFSNSNNNPNL
jgi:hypothetical protein